MISLPPEEYFKMMYRIPTAAVGLITDTQGRLLILKRSYADGYGVPGGMLNEGESPRDACRREVWEETGLDLKPGALCAVAHYDCENSTYKNEQITFSFDLPALNDEQVAAIRLSDEHTSFRFVSDGELSEYFDEAVSRRIRKFLDAKRSGTCIYLEHQELPK